MECKICRSTLYPEDQFCPACGTKVEREPSSTPAQDLKTDPTPPKNLDPPITKEWNSLGQAQSAQSNYNWESPNNLHMDKQNDQWGTNWDVQTTSSEYYQQPVNAQRYPVIPPKLSEPADRYMPPNTLLNIVIILHWIGFLLMVIISLLSSIFSIFLLVIFVPISYGFYWLAKMLRRYSEGAKNVAITLAVISLALGLFSGTISFSLLINGYILYVLAFHEETKNQYRRYKIISSQSYGTPNFY